MNRIFIIIIIGTIVMSCSGEKNPLLTTWNTPFETPPFSEIKDEHYIPAFKEAIRIHNEEIRKITKSTSLPDFGNTVLALEQSGELLERVNRVYSAMRGAKSNKTISDISPEISELTSRHNDDIYLDAALFKRIKKVYEEQKDIAPGSEENKLVEKFYREFIRGGANLKDEEKNELRKINARLALLSIKFGENVLNENNRFEMVIENENDLAGLSEDIINAASEEAENRGYKGKWVFTIQKPSMIPFLQYSSKRDLREKIYRAYFMKGDNGDELDNKNILREMASLRYKKAKLLGYKSHAHFVLEENMAENPENVYKLLMELWKPAIKVAEKEKDEMQKIIRQEGDKFELQPWDWWYYAEKVKKAKYDLDENETRPYFKVENVIAGVFGLATDLWGIRFEERKDIEVYHPEVKVFEVKEKDGAHIGILYTDYFPRESKRGGAWMEAFRKQRYINGKKVSPIVYNVGNLTKPTKDKPSLLSIDEVYTLFHEFGHALHDLLADCKYKSLSGTEVPQDFVEFPSQVMENWCMHPEVLSKYAKHYQTGEIIPDELIGKIEKAGKFNQGFATAEYLAAAILDMDWHTLKTVELQDVREFEKKSMKKIGLIDEIIPRYRSTYFRHIFAGEYSSGYYSYIWSEVLDADAFEAFKEKGIYNQELAKAYREEIIAPGGSKDVMKQYIKFRGKEPATDALMKKRGLN